MDLSFYPLTLEAIDQAAAEALCLFIAEGERPLTGLAGLADWRLSGRLSRLLRQGVLTGSAGEAVLTPPGARLAFRKLFVFGVGSAQQSEEALIERLAEGLRKIAQAGVQEAAMQLPSRLSPDLGIRTLIDELQGPLRALVFGPDPAKLVSALSHAATRGQTAAQHERRVVKVETPLKPSVSVPKWQPRPPLPPPAVPKASPLSFAPSGVPASEMTPPPPAQIPRASPLPFAPSGASATSPAAAPLAASPLAASSPAGSPASSAAPLAVAPAKPALPPAAKPAEPPGPASPERPAAQPSQRFVPPPPKPHVFETGRGKGKKGR